MSHGPYGRVRGRCDLRGSCLAAFMLGKETSRRIQVPKHILVTEMDYSLGEDERRITMLVAHSRWSIAKCGQRLQCRGSFKQSRLILWDEPKSRDSDNKWTQK